MNNKIQYKCIYLNLSLNDYYLEIIQKNFK